ncbi:MAG: UPF0758 domain-containing protein [Longimicrobiales bacterium]
MSRSKETPLHLPIHAWSPQDRPRERLRALGPAGLSNRELLAILIGSGGAGESALDVADRVLSAHPSLRRLASLPSGALEAEAGITRRKALMIF